MGAAPVPISFECGGQQSQTLASHHPPVGDPWLTIGCCEDDPMPQTIQHAPRNPRFARIKIPTRQWHQDRGYDRVSLAILPNASFFIEIGFYS